MRDRSIAHIVTRFPNISESFIISDMTAMRNIWPENHVFAFFKKSGTVPEWITKIHYFPIPRLYLMSQWHFLTKNPGRYFFILKNIITGHISKKRELFKALAAWPNMVHAAYVVEQEPIDAVHAHWANIPATTAFVISKFLDKPFTCTGHAHDLYKFNAFLPVILKNCRLFLTSTHYNRRYLLKTYPEVNPDIIKVYSHGVDVQLLSPGPVPKRSPFVIASIGRMTWQKGFQTLLQALRILLDDGLFVRLDFLALPGHLSKEIITLARDLNVNDSINWLLPCPHDQMVNIYRNAHVFALPCEIGPHGDRDGIPNVILEASACGIPCVATPISGLPEAVIHGKTGLLVNPQDPAALAAAISRLYVDETLRLQFGKAARKHVEKNYHQRQCRDLMILLMRDAHA